MFSRVATLFSFLFFVFPLLTSASAIAVRQTQCNFGELQCCTIVESETSQDVTNIASALGVPLQGDDLALAGLACSPISVIGIGGNSCNGQPVCCTGGNFGGGLLVLGCNPVVLNT